MSNTLFRKTSMDRISSPEQLNEYIRVSTPSVWMLLAAIIVLLVGVCVWGVFGTLDTELAVLAVAENGSVTLYVKESDAKGLTEGMNVKVEDYEGTLPPLSPSPAQVNEDFSEYMRHVGGLQMGEFVYEAVMEAPLADGVYTGKIITQSVSPLSFVLN